MSAHAAKSLLPSLPPLRIAHWLIRLPLAAIILDQSVQKLGDLEAGAAAFGLPLALWTLVAVGELLAGAGLLVGGLLRGGLGDLVTRLSGLVIGAVVVGAIVIAYWPISFVSVQFHLMLLAGALYLALRGNAA